MRVRDAKLEELVLRPRALSARQIAVQRRSQIISLALMALERDPTLVKRVDLDPGEKFATIRAAVARQIVQEHKGSRVVVRGGTIFLAGDAAKT